MHGHANFSYLRMLSGNSLCCLPNRVTVQNSDTQLGVIICIWYGDVREMQCVCAQTATLEVSNILVSFVWDPLSLSQAWHCNRLFSGALDYKPYHDHVHFTHVCIKFRCTNLSNHKLYRHEIWHTYSWRFSGSAEFFFWGGGPIYL
jgi:hypothetical protein